jgi:hypothetical protein
MNNSEIDELWQQLTQTNNQFHILLQEFQKSPKKIDILKRELTKGDRTTAIIIAEYLNNEELKEIFNELIFLASFVHGQIVVVRKLVLSLPKDWLLQHIEPVAENILVNGTDEEYRRLLELYLQIDDNLVNKLIERAQLSSNSNIQEVGQDFKLK